MSSSLPEVWLRGPLPEVPPLLQPVAHALLQAREEVAGIMADFPAARLAERPLGLAAVGFHLRHGTWSAFTTLGANTSAAMRHRLNVLAYVVAGVVTVGFLLPPYSILLGLVS